MNKINVAMLGARMHYAVPRIFQNRGSLGTFYTDLSAASGWPRWFSLIPERLRTAAIQRILSRVAADVPKNRIVAYNRFGWEYARRRRKACSPSEMTEVFLWANQRFGKLVCGSDWGGAKAIFTFNGAALEILQAAKEKGVTGILEQTIAPHALEQELMQAENLKHPEWEMSCDDKFADAYSAREQAEWNLAEVIVCGSEFVKEGIKYCGGPVDKCVVVPYGVDFRMDRANANLESKIGSDSRKFRVLTVGTVGLRKGAPYVAAAAQAMSEVADFRWVGHGHVTEDAQQIMQQHIEMPGSVPRSSMNAHYEWADAFLLPSVCEGSATVTYEAMAAGLPVVCTANAGSVVRNGLDGIIVPTGDVDSIVEALQLLIGSPERLRNMRASALERAEQFTVEHYGANLIQSINSGRPP